MTDSGDARFAVGLYAQLAGAPGNLCFSPASVRVALAMTYAGARGDTAEQMARALALGDAGHDEMAAQLEAWGVSRDGSPPPPSAVLRVVNRLFAQRGGRFVEAFLVRLADSYRAPLGALDFAAAPELSRQAINRWVGEQTDGNIAQLIPDGAIDTLTRLVVTNAVLFKAAWDRPFVAERTRPGQFNTQAGARVDAPFMRASGEYQLAELPDVLMLELPYAGTYAMDVILPRRSSDLPEIERQLCSGGLATWLGELRRRQVDLSLPRFKLASELRLDDALRAMGMVDAFSGQADFSGINDEALVVSAVLHQAQVDVDEQGTVAAAATAVVMGARGLPPRQPPPVEFRANHPFVFAIRDLATGAILFLGRVSDPR